MKVFESRVGENNQKEFGDLAEITPPKISFSPNLRGLLIKFWKLGPAQFPGFDFLMGRNRGRNFVVSTPAARKCFISLLCEILRYPDLNGTKKWFGRFSREPKSMMMIKPKMCVNCDFFIAARDFSKIDFSRSEFIAPISHLQAIHVPNGKWQDKSAFTKSSDTLRLFVDERNENNRFILIDYNCPFFVHLSLWSLSCVL